MMKNKGFIGTRRHNLYRLAITSAVGVMAVGLSTEAIAQVAADSNSTSAAEETTGTIVVTAQRRRENLQRVPIAISVATAEKLQTSGVATTAQLASVVSGVTVSVNAQSFSPYVRGVGTPAFGPGLENPVALYVDDVYYASQVMGLTDTSDVSQVSVLKGPQGTLFGRNATGGVIQLTTRQPDDHFHGEVRTEVDQYVTSRSNIFVTGPIGDHVKASLSAGYTTQGQGWGRNLATGDDVHKIDDQVSLRGKVYVDLTPSTLLKFNADYFNVKGPIGPNLRPNPGSTPLLPGFTDRGNVYNVDSDVQNYTRNRNYGGSFVVEQTVSSIKLVSITAYRKFKFDTVFDVDATPVPGFSIQYGFNGRQFSQELQILSKDNSAFNWVAGAYYFDGREGLSRFNNVFAIPPFSIPGLGDVTQISKAGSQQTRSVALFGQATVTLLTDTRLTAGFRYTWEKRSLDGATETTFVGPIALPVSYPKVPQKVQRPTWRVALDHDFLPGLMGYLSYNRGFKSGGYQAVTAALDAYKPEKLDAYEAGFKATLLDRRLRLNPAVFYYDYSNIQLLRLDPNAQVVNGKKAELYGIDLDTDFSVNDALSLNAGAEWLHAKIKSFPDATCSLPFPTGGTLVVPCDASGKRIPYAPKFTFNLGATYRFELAGAKMAFNVNDSYNSGYFTESENVLLQKNYHMVNGLLSWKSNDERVEVQAFVRNILDEAVSPYRTTTSFYGYIADFTSPPRTYGVSAKWAFGK